MWLFKAVSALRFQLIKYRLKLITLCYKNKLKRSQNYDLNCNVSRLNSLTMIIVKYSAANRTSKSLFLPKWQYFKVHHGLKFKCLWSAAILVRTNILKFGLRHYTLLNKMFNFIPNATLCKHFFQKKNLRLLVENLIEFSVKSKVSLSTV